MDSHAVQTCRWATPTLFLPWPLWYDASQFEWSCTRGAQPRGIEDPHSCESCPGWETPAHDAACRCHHCHEDDHLGSIAP